MTVDIDDSSGGLEHSPAIPMAFRDADDLFLTIAYHGDVCPDAIAVGGDGGEVWPADGDGNGGICGAQGGDKLWHLGVVGREAHDPNKIRIMPCQGSIECKVDNSSTMSIGF